MPGSDEIVEALRALAAVFESVGATWYLMGGQAAILHGARRFTQDIDVTVEIAPARVEALVASLTEAGFGLRFSDPEFVATTQVMPVFSPARVPVDIVLAGSGAEHRIAQRAVYFPVGDLRVPVAAPEDLIVMKVLAGRPTDLQDCEAVLQAVPTIDVTAVRAFLAELEEALDQSDLIPTFESLLARVRRR